MEIALFTFLSVSFLCHYDVNIFHIHPLIILSLHSFQLPFYATMIKIYSTFTNWWSYYILPIHINIKQPWYMPTLISDYLFICPPITIQHFPLCSSLSFMCISPYTVLDTSMFMPLCQILRLSVHLILGLPFCVSLDALVFLSEI